ncbi:T9SS type A sorting domain-containing protein, partial [bacterium]|nr:T9SS type A sorting domain-containing protein [bacterium]
PNPARGPVRLGYELAAAGSVRLAVYSVAGQLVATLADGNAAAGRHEAAWNGTDRAGRTMPSGVYFARLATAGGTLTQRLIVLR